MIRIVNKDWRCRLDDIVPAHIRVSQFGGMGMVWYHRGRFAIGIPTLPYNGTGVLAIRVRWNSTISSIPLISIASTCYTGFLSGSKMKHYGVTERDARDYRGLARRVFRFTLKITGQWK